MAGFLKSDLGPHSHSYGGPHPHHGPVPHGSLPPGMTMPPLGIGFPHSLEVGFPQSMWGKYRSQFSYMLFQR